MKTTGMIMTGIGVPTLIAGVVLYINWASDEVNSSSSSSSTSIDGRAIGGLALMVVGELLTGGGIALWAIGGSKAKKYQRILDEKSANLYYKSIKPARLCINSGKNGVGLALRF